MTGLLNLSLIFCIINIIHSVSNSVLNIEELNSIHYHIDIVNNPVLKNQEWTTDFVTVTNKHGQEYICTLPKVEIPENENKKEEDLLDQLVDISELLKPMEAAPCLIKKKDWWSYEFCYGSVIKQYHLEDNKVVGTILILGKYESEYNWRNNTKSKNKLQKFHMQHYVNGTRCDITGEARRAEVRFHCEEGVGDYIQQVDEPESCRYVIIIATTRVCHHPYLKPNPNWTPHNINCAPALTQDELNHYQKVQESKKQTEESDSPLLAKEGGSAGDMDQQNPSGGILGSTSGDNASKDAARIDNDEDSRFSIRLVTIPIKKNSKLSKNILKSEIRGLLSDSDDADDEVISSDVNDNDVLPSIEEPLREELIQNDDERRPLDAQNLGSPKSYLSVSELLEKEFSEMLEEESAMKSEESERKKKKMEGKERRRMNGEITIQDLDEEEEAEKDVEKQFEAFRGRMKKLTHKWMDIQNEDHIHELLDKIKHSLDENVKELQETVNQFSESSLLTYLNDLVDMAEKYKKKLAKTENVDFTDDEKVTEALQTLTAILSEAEFKVLRAIREMKFDRMERYLKNQIKDTEGEGGGAGAGAGAFSPEDNEDAPFLAAHEDELDTEDEGKTNDRSPPSDSPLPPFSRSPSTLSYEFEDGDKENDDGEDELEEDTEETRHVKIVNDKSLETDQKTKLEQSIKERLEKSGLDNIGRKIEVKILTPNYFDDDEKDTLSALSQEETEAFHNMIVNILSASAEELKERERHKNLESSYNFQLDEMEELTEEPRSSFSIGQDSVSAEILPVHDSSQDDRSSNDINDDVNDIIDDSNDNNNNNDNDNLIDDILN